MTSRSCAKKTKVGVFSEHSEDSTRNTENTEVIGRQGAKPSKIKAQLQLTDL